MFIANGMHKTEQFVGDKIENGFLFRNKWLGYAETIYYTSRSIWMHIMYMAFKEHWDI